MPNVDAAERLKKKIYRLFVALLVVYVLVSSFVPMLNQVDLGWQIAQGQWMAEHGTPYSRDAFNYPNLGRAVINEYPLFELALFAAYRVGWWGPNLLAALGFVALVLVPVRCASRGGLLQSFPVIAAIGLMPLFFIVAFPLRPHLVTYVCVMALGAFLLDHRKADGYREFWPMVIMQIAWTNCHSGFVLGPAMVGLFGAEVSLRAWVCTRSFPFTTARTWFGVFLLVLLACLVNPYGWARFYPLLLQDSLESIRAYVGEMQPLVGGRATLYSYLTLSALGVVAAAIVRARGAISWSFLLLTVLIYLQAQTVYKAWPLFGLFVPLLVLSSGAFASANRKSAGWVSVGGTFLITAFAAIAIMARLNPHDDSSLQRQWQQYSEGRSELPLEAVAWMKSHQVEGRLFHRCEDGGWLQMNGYNHGETFSDTGFGKYDEAFIHEIGLVSERPALLPKYLMAYHPDFVISDNFSFQWPFYLRQQGWRLIFYSPNSSVWTRPEIRNDLPSVDDKEIKDTFDHDLSTKGKPADVRLLGRNLIALNSLGLEDFAFAKLTGLPPEFHSAPWYWEAARFLCFSTPHFSAAHRDALALEALNLHQDATTAEFRAYVRYCVANDIEGARQILEAIPYRQLGNDGAELLLKIDVDCKRAEALKLARRRDCFDLRNGHRWKYLAEAEDQAGNVSAAAAAWKKAVFYAPDDEGLMTVAYAFATAQGDMELAKAVAESGKVYGAQ